jgi:hypothetical protein
MKLMLLAGGKSDLNTTNSKYIKINPGTFSIYVQRMYAFLNTSGTYVSVAACELQYGGPISGGSWAAVREKLSVAIRRLLYEWTYQWRLVSCCMSGPISGGSSVAVRVDLVSFLRRLVI